MDEFARYLWECFMGQQPTKPDVQREIVPGGMLMRTTTLTMIQEGEWTEIENTETTEIAIRELAN